MKAMLLPVVALGSSLFFLASASQQSENVYVSLIPKAQNPASLSRLAGPTEDLVVTRTEIDSPLATHRVSLREHDELFVVELFDKQAELLPGELFREGTFAVVKLWKQEPMQHVHMGDVRNFVSRVDTEQKELAKPKAPKRVWNFERPKGKQNIAIDEAELKQWVAEFSGAADVVLNGETTKIAERGSPMGRAQARAWLKQQYEALGYTTSTHTYRTGENFIAERAGADTNKTLIVSAHLDSVGNAGADDDGTGTISALAVAKLLAQVPLKMNLRIVGFDQEEIGLVGSAAYARSLSESGEAAKIFGVVNIEMSGFDEDNDGGYHAIHCNENTSKTLADAFIATAKENDLNLDAVNACTNRSDHASFWRYNVPAIVVSQNFFGGDSNPCYHLSCDKIEKVNFSYMTELTKALALSVKSIVSL